MRKRNFEYIKETGLFKSLISTHNLQFEFYESELIMWNENLIVNIYGFTIERTFYINFLSKDLKLQTNSSGVLPKERMPEFRKRYQEYIILKTEVIGESEPVNKEVLHRAEKFLFFYFELITEFLTDYFTGKKSLNKENHKPIEDHNRLKLESFFDRK